jgi:undecaprenyl-phosphate 4-deoxy-4-formamido-L-arabinose transferase
MEPLAPSISVVVPVYRSERLLRPLVERLAPVLEKAASERELILVDDGSPDGSWSVDTELAREHRWIRGMRLMRNYGQHGAILCGIRAARHELVLTMDDDLQHPPEEIPKVLAALGPDVDVVYGTPEAEHHGLARDLASQIAKLVLQDAMGADTARKVSAFRVFRHAIARGVRGLPRPVRVDRRPPDLGDDAVPLDPREARAPPRGGLELHLEEAPDPRANMMTGFSVFPLQIASLVGFAFTLFGIGILVFVVGRYLVSGSPVQGFTFLASMIAIFSGAQLFALGILGEYLARIHFRAMDRPTYAVGSRTEPAP